MNGKVQAKLQGWIVVFTHSLAAAAVALTFSLSAYAAPTEQEAFEECKRTQNSAKQVMKARQEGTPMSSLWEVAEGAGDEYVTGLFKSLIQEAYKIPLYPNESQRQQAITDFQNNFFAACIVTLGKVSSPKS